MKKLLHPLRLALTLLAITSCVAAAMAGVNQLTRHKIAAIEAQKTQDAIAQVLEGQPTQRQLTGDTGMVKALYESEQGYAVLVVCSGFGGDITMMVGVSKEASVTGISIISHAETAGLGSVAAEDSAKGEAFRSQFVQLQQAAAVDKDGGQIDAITGATISSQAITAGVNAALAFVKEGL